MLSPSANARSCGLNRLRIVSYLAASMPGSSLSAWVLMIGVCRSNRSCRATAGILGVCTVTSWWGYLGRCGGCGFVRWLDKPGANAIGHGHPRGLCEVGLDQSAPDGTIDLAVKITYALGREVERGGCCLVEHTSVFGGWCGWKARRKATAGGGWLHAWLERKPARPIPGGGHRIQLHHQAASGRFENGPDMKGALALLPFIVGPLGNSGVCFKLFLHGFG